MATQRLTIATIAGNAAIAIGNLFDALRVNPNPSAVDQLCASVRDNGLALPMVYFCEWTDRWLMGDLVPGPDKLEGLQFEATCLSPQQAVAWAGRCGNQFQEQEWFATRLHEAAIGWGSVAERYAIVVIRHVIGGWATDDEVSQSLSTVPQWLAVQQWPTDPNAEPERGGRG
jgi:hypothetical protein